MNMTINCTTFHISEKFQEFIEQRVMRAIARFSHHIQDVTVVVTDVNASKGGVDKHCRITVSMWSGVLMSEAQEENEMSAVDVASRRIRRVIKKKLQRPRSISRRARLEFSDWSNEDRSVVIQ